MRCSEIPKKGGDGRNGRDIANLFKASWHKLVQVNKLCCTTQNQFHSKNIFRSMAMKKVHNYGQSVKAKLLNIARKERQQYQLLLTRYLQERFLYRLSISQHRKHFLLKGGALLYAHEQFYARPTLDIDFMGSCINNDRESVQLVMKEICEITYEQNGVIFLSETLQISEKTNIPALELH